MQVRRTSLALIAACGLLPVFAGVASAAPAGPGAPMVRAMPTLKVQFTWCCGEHVFLDSRESHAAAVGEFGALGALAGPVGAVVGAMSGDYIGQVLADNDKCIEVTLPQQRGELYSCASFRGLNSDIPEPAGVTPQTPGTADVTPQTPGTADVTPQTPDPAENPVPQGQYGNRY